MSRRLIHICLNSDWKSCFLWGNVTSVPLGTTQDTFSLLFWHPNHLATLAFYVHQFKSPGSHIICKIPSEHLEMCELCPWMHFNTFSTLLMRKCTRKAGLTLVQMKACHLFGAKSLHNLTTKGSRYTALGKKLNHWKYIKRVSFRIKTFGTLCKRISKVLNVAYTGKVCTA